MLEDEKGVIAALPFCDSGRVEVWAKKGTLTEKKAKSIIHLEKDFKVMAFAAKAPAADAAKGEGAGKGEKKARKKGRRRNRRNRKNSGDTDRRGG